MDKSSESAVIMTTPMQQSRQLQKHPLTTKNKHQSTSAISPVLQIRSGSHDQSSSRQV
jgi:hypothetical protein